jgi:hypothetical protein
MLGKLKKIRDLRFFWTSMNLRVHLGVFTLVAIIVLSLGIPSSSDVLGCGGGEDSNGSDPSSKNYLPFVFQQNTNTNINECKKGLDSCHSLAKCTDLKNGYKCECPSGLDGDGRWCQSKDIALYVVPAIRSKRLLPTTMVRSSYLGRKISMRVSPTEYESATFFIRALKKKFNTITLTCDAL